MLSSYALHSLFLSKYLHLSLSRSRALSLSAGQLWQLVMRFVFLLRLRRVVIAKVYLYLSHGQLSSAGKWSH